MANAPDNALAFRRTEEDAQDYARWYSETFGKTVTVRSYGLGMAQFYYVEETTMATQIWSMRDYEEYATYMQRQGFNAMSFSDWLESHSKEAETKAAYEKLSQD